MEQLIWPGRRQKLHADDFKLRTLLFVVWYDNIELLDTRLQDGHVLDIPRTEILLTTGYKFFNVIGATASSMILEEFNKNKTVKLLCKKNPEDLIMLQPTEYTPSVRIRYGS
jgi:hypothetical protein